MWHHIQGREIICFDKQFIPTEASVGIFVSIENVNPV